MSDLPLMPPFTESDLRTADKHKRFRHEPLAKLWVEEATEDHEDGAHSGAWHPFCEHCERFVNDIEGKRALMNESAQTLVRKIHACRWDDVDLSTSQGIAAALERFQILDRKITATTDDGVKYIRTLPPEQHRHAVSLLPEEARPLADDFIAHREASVRYWWVWDAAAEETLGRARRWIMLRGTRHPVVSVAPQTAVPVDYGLLVDVGERTSEKPQWRVEGLLPARAGMLLVAAAKTGKTTLVLQLARSLLTGEDFLSKFPTEPITGTVAILNYEVDAATMARWCREHGLPGDRVLLVNLRGHRNLLADEGRQALVDILTEHQASVLIVDPFAVAYTGSDADRSTEVRPWLAALDELATQAGCSELVLTNHTGHNQERSRNSSALLDWADTIVTITKDSNGHRYLRAEGRDVDVAEDRLDFDASTRTHRMSGGGSRQQLRGQQTLTTLAQEVAAIVTDNPGINVSGLDAKLRAAGFGLQHGDAGKAAKLATELNLIRRESGKNNSLRHYPVVPSSPEHSRSGGVVSSPESSIEDGTTTTTTETHHGDAA